VDRLLGDCSVDVLRRRRSWKWTEDISGAAPGADISGTAAGMDVPGPAADE
jgi:hypothetical protein